MPVMETVPLRNTADGSAIVVEVTNAVPDEEAVFEELQATTKADAIRHSMAGAAFSKCCCGACGMNELWGSGASSYKRDRRGGGL
jgi:hypothetical protein